MTRQKLSYIAAALAAVFIIFFLLSGVGAQTARRSEERRVGKECLRPV